MLIRCTWYIITSSIKFRYWRWFIFGIYCDGFRNLLPFSEAYTLFMNGLCLMCSKAPASERGMEYHQDAITFHVLSFDTRWMWEWNDLQASAQNIHHKLCLHDTNQLSRYHEAMAKLAYVLKPYSFTCKLDPDLSLKWLKSGLMYEKISRDK